MADLAQNQPQQPQEQPQQGANQSPMEQLVVGIHDGMVQLLQNVEGQVSPNQKQAIANALQTYRQAIAQLGGEDLPPAERGGNTTLEQGAVAETIPV